jgi:SAM-dependent methyltransferase
MGTAAMIQAQKRFSIEITVGHWHNLYAELMLLPKREHPKLISEKGDLGESLFTLSMNGTERGRSIIGHFQCEIHKKIEHFPQALFAETRGTPFHYLRFFPESNYLRYAVKSLRQIRPHTGKGPFKAPVTLKKCWTASAYQMATKHRNCPVCGKNKVTLQADLTYALFDDLEVSGVSPLVTCNCCGMLFNDCDITENQLDLYYRKNEYYAASTGGGSGGLSPDDQWRYEAIWEKVVPLIPNAPVVVDFGCGKGGFPFFLFQKGMTRCFGIEKSESCRDNAETGFIIFDSLEKLPVQQTDLIILSHIIEHLLAPQSFISKISTLCSPGTILYCEVPNAASYFGEQPQWERCYFEHLSHFTCSTLQQLWLNQGFEVIASGVRPFTVGDAAEISLYVILRKNSTYTQQSYPIEPVLPVFFDPSPIRQIVKEIYRRSERYALWGVSQYLMLLMGMVPQLINSAEKLYDSSEAKKGRTIRGRVIEPAEKLFASVNQYDRILIPRSAYTESMVQQISLYTKDMTVTII